VLRGLSDVSKGAQLDMFGTNESRGAAAGGRHCTQHPWTLLQGVHATCETRRLRATESDQTGQRSMNLRDDVSNGAPQRFRSSALLHLHLCAFLR